MNSSRQSFFHSRTVCDISASDGTMKRTSFPLPASVSAMRRPVKVLPVPQAMMSLPRSAVARPSCTACNASRWWSRSSFLGARLMVPVRMYCDQLIRLASSWSIPIRFQSFERLSSVSLALRPNSLRVVSAITRRVK